MENIEISKPIIYTYKNILELKDLPILEGENGGQIYVYVILNSPQKYIKIGQTTNIIQRMKSLSGSNSGGNKIIKIFVSPPTYVKSMEKAIHEHYHKYRIEGTEWFRELDFEDVVKHVNNLFQTNYYYKCNEVRKEIYEKGQGKKQIEEPIAPVEKGKKKINDNKRN